MATASRAVRATGPKEDLYTWEGKDKTGKVVRGEIRATGDAMVQAMLRRQGIQVSKVKKHKMARGGRISDKDIALFTRQLATMMKSGVPLLQAFDIAMKGSGNAALSRLLNDIRNDVETGLNLSQAFAKHPVHFDKLFCNLVAAGEQAGILDSLLDRIATYKEKILAIKSKIKSALFYPAAVVVVAGLVVSVMMLFVIPEFKSVFASFGADLPAPTMMVIAMSDFFVQSWYLVFGALIGAIVFIAWSYKRSTAMQIALDRTLLRFPVIGPIIRKATVARWTRTLSTMFAAGVPLVEALDSVGGAVRRWKRETSPPVTKVPPPSIGRFIAWLRNFSSWSLLTPAGTLTVPLAINQVWSMDFMHDQLEDGRSFRLLNGELRAHAQWPWHAGRHRTA